MDRTFISVSVAVIVADTTAEITAVEDPAEVVAGTEVATGVIDSAAGRNAATSCAWLMQQAHFLFGRYNEPAMEKIVRTLSEFEIEAARFAGELPPTKKGATLITLSGELGAGKTAFTKVVAKTLGVEDVVNSPTFVLEKIYLLEGQPFKHLIHIDAYRLEKGADLAPLGFDELMQDADNLILLEWPEKVASALPEPAVRISLVAQNDGSRIISYTYE